MTECHPAFPRPMPAKLQGARLIRRNPYFIPTSAGAHIDAPIRVGLDKP